MLSKDERIQSEKIFWKNTERFFRGHGKSFSWHKAGALADKKSMPRIIDHFHNDDTVYGFYGLTIQLGFWNGFDIQLLVEVQKEIVLGVQIKEVNAQFSEEDHFSFSDLLVHLSNSGKNWQFDAIGMLAWKLPSIRFDFRNTQNRSVVDVYCFQEDSEALVRFHEELADVLVQLDALVKQKQIHYHGTIIN